jgi:hypothetical protein
LTTAGAAASALLQNKKKCENKCKNKFFLNFKPMCGVAQSWCGVAQLGCGVAQTVVRRLARRQAEFESRLGTPCAMHKIASGLSRSNHTVQNTLGSRTFILKNLFLISKKEGG